VKLLYTNGESRAVASSHDMRVKMTTNYDYCTSAKLQLMSHVANILFTA